MGRDETRGKALRRARSRALERLRTMYDKVYQRLVDEELIKMGHEPRGRQVPRMNREGKNDERDDD